MIYLDLTLRDIQCARQPFVIGRRGTAGVLSVRIDYSAWRSAYGAGVLNLLVKPYGASAAYPVLLEDDGGFAVWQVSSLDTQTTGVGQAELLYHPDNASVDKSAVFGVSVLPDIGRPLSELPDAYEDWVSRLEQLGAEAQSAAATATQAAAAAAESAEAAAESRDEAARSEASAETSETNAAGSSAAAAESEDNAEAWAVGERGGVAVDNTDETYHNNAKYWCSLAEQHAEEAGYVFFNINQSTGRMEAVISDNLSDKLTFRLNTSTGRMEAIFT